MERIQKILAHGGIASRRAAEQMIKAGRVRVNGRVVTELGVKADERRDRIEVDGKRVVAEDLIYIVLNKPRGVVSTMSDPEGRPTVHELLTTISARIYPVGRLDFATSGVLLATNDGELADGLLHPRKTVPKTYVLKVKGVMKPDDIEVWRKGIRLEDGMTLPADAKLLRHEGDKTWMELTIKEGRNQMIRRMGEATGFPVMRLARVAFAEISAEGLAPGRWRHLTRDELVALKKTYGVPRSIPSAGSIPESPANRRSAVDPTRGFPAGGRSKGGFGEDTRSDTRSSTSRDRDRPNDGPRTGDRRDHAPTTTGGRRGGSSSRGSQEPTRGRRGGSNARGSQESPTGGRGGGGGGSSSRGSQESPQGRGGGSPRPQESPAPRFGGGSPGRRPYDVKDDWGGGAGRGRSSSSTRGGGDDRAQENRPRGDVGGGGASESTTGGRAGRSRTTGTAGGIGARSDAPRVKGRRGR